MKKIKEKSMKIICECCGAIRFDHYKKSPQEVKRKIFKCFKCYDDMVKFANDTKKEKTLSNHDFLSLFEF